MIKKRSRGAYPEHEYVLLSFSYSGDDTHLFHVLAYDSDSKIVHLKWIVGPRDLEDVKAMSLGEFNCFFKTGLTHQEMTGILDKSGGIP